jgi:rapamycin-insensitive companion of mTOR
MEVKGGVHEISRAVLRAVVAIAEHTDDRLRMICIETLAEICNDPDGYFGTSKANCIK